MTVLAVGLSHRSAPVSVLERITVPVDDVRKTVEELHAADSVSEVLLLSTCNRVEVYADVARFHRGVDDITAVLARHAGMEVADLADYLYVHFADAAVEHILRVASGLDSMVVGESQILGQLRTAYSFDSDLGVVGSVLHELVQTALRVGKRAHTDTGIDRVGASIVSVAIDRAEATLGALTDRRAVVVGAGSMSALAANTLHRRGVRDLTIVNRTLQHAQRLADTLGARAVPMSALGDVLGDADVLLSCTGSTGLVVELGQVAERDGRPLVVLDIALPRDVDPGVGELPGVDYVDLEQLSDGPGAVSEAEVLAASAIVAEELRAYLRDQQQLAVAPTVTALRARANDVIDAELARLDARAPTLSAAQRRAVSDAVRRAVEKVLHAPTVRVKELAATPGGNRYAAALRELFDLDPATPESVAALKSMPTPLPSDIDEVTS